MPLARLVVTVALLATLAGCANQLRGMRALPAGQASLRPPADRAAVIFLRPASSAGALSASLFELRPGAAEDRFVGILVAETQLVDHVPPGKTRFMVLGRGAEFLDADLEAGRTYVVALLPPPAGTSDSFFALVPVREPGPAAVRQCREHCVWVENTDQSRAWSRRTWHSIQQKKLTYLPQWEARQPRPVLRAADGR